jgi:hypothetical protein
MSHRLTNRYVHQASLEFAALQESFNLAAIELTSAREVYEQKLAEHADAERALSLATQGLSAAATASPV